MGNTLNIFSFSEVRTDRMRLMFEPQSESKFAGIYKGELYGN